MWKHVQTQRLRNLERICQFSGIGAHVLKVFAQSLTWQGLPKYSKILQMPLDSNNKNAQSKKIAKILELEHDWHFQPLKTNMKASSSCLALGHWLLRCAKWQKASIRFSLTEIHGIGFKDSNMQMVSEYFEMTGADSSLPRLWSSRRISLELRLSAKAKRQTNLQNKEIIETKSVSKQWKLVFRKACESLV